MFKFIDERIERMLKSILHRKREAIIQKAIQVFRERHPDKDVAKYSKLLETEANRVYAIIDRSILRERIQRAKYTFWVTSIIGVFFVAAVGGFTFGAALPFMAPLLTALIAWVLSLMTIPVSYNQRVKGAMDSVLANYEANLKNEMGQLFSTLQNGLKDEKKIEISPAQIQVLIEMIQERTNAEDNGGSVMRERKDESLTEIHEHKMQPINGVHNFWRDPHEIIDRMSSELPDQIEQRLPNNSMLQV